MTPSGLIEVRTSTLAASGQAARLAFELTRDRVPFYKTTDPADVQRFMPSTNGNGHPHPRFMCHACWSFQPPYEDDRLGLTGLGGYCQRCTARFVAACLQRHHRLPRLPFEFWCRRCGRIQTRDLLFHEHGVKRMICRPCRQVVQKRANERFRARRRRRTSIARC